MGRVTKHIVTKTSIKLVLQRGSHVPFCGRGTKGTWDPYTHTLQHRGISENHQFLNKYVSSQSEYFKPWWYVVLQGHDTAVLIKSFHTNKFGAFILNFNKLLPILDHTLSNLHSYCIEITQSSPSVTDVICYHDNHHDVM